MKNSLLIIFCISLFWSCQTTSSKKSEKLKVVTTTTMITDLVKNIGRDSVQVEGLMGSGVDPHLYKASEGDVGKLTQADVVFYSGLHLEGKLVDVFEKMGRHGKTIALAEILEEDDLITSNEFSGNYDPHIWFDISYWKKVTKNLTKHLSEQDPESANFYKQNEKVYLDKLNDLEKEVKKIIAELPEEKRILVTAHDAFSYFGKAYGFKVVGLQGLSTVTEAGVKDVRRLSQLIIDKEVKAIFIESSVPRRTIEALQQSVKAKGFNVEIGGTLYSDALGSLGTEEGTYIGMFKYNVRTIVDALK